MDFIYAHQVRSFPNNFPPLADIKMPYVILHSILISSDLRIQFIQYIMICFRRDCCTESHFTHIPICRTIVRYLQYFLSFTFCELLRLRYFFSEQYPVFSLPLNMTQTSVYTGKFFSDIRHQCLCPVLRKQHIGRNRSFGRSKARHINPSDSKISIPIYHHE